MFDDSDKRRLGDRKSRQDAMDGFIAWALAEWGAPTEAECARAEEILSRRSR